MRPDYALYTVAIICFIVTGIALVQQTEQLWIILPIVFGFFFIGWGYTQRPKAEATLKTVTETRTVEVLPPPPQAPVVEETVEKVIPVIKDLKEVRGIGEKRAAQLSSVGISSVEDLAKSSAEDLASKLKISPKIISVWIENAKKLIEEH